MGKSVPSRKREKVAARKGRQPLRIADGTGRAIYEAMVRQRRADGQVWGVRDLAGAMGLGVNTPTAWIGGRMPQGANLKRLAEVLGTSIDALVRPDLLEVQLIGLPEWAKQAVRARREAADAHGRSEAMLRGQLPPAPGSARAESA